MVERLVYTEKVSGSNPLLPKSKNFSGAYESKLHLLLFNSVFIESGALS